MTGFWENDRAASTLNPRVLTSCMRTFSKLWPPSLKPYRVRFSHTHTHTQKAKTWFQNRSKKFWTFPGIAAVTPHVRPNQGLGEVGELGCSLCTDFHRPVDGKQVKVCTWLLRACLHVSNPSAFLRMCLRSGVYVNSSIPLWRWEWNEVYYSLQMFVFRQFDYGKWRPRPHIGVAMSDWDEWALNRVGEFFITGALFIHDGWVDVASVNLKPICGVCVDSYVEKAKTNVGPVVCIVLISNASNDTDRAYRGHRKSSYQSNSDVGWVCQGESLCMSKLLIGLMSF